MSSSRRSSIALAFVAALALAPSAHAAAWSAPAVVPGSAGVLAGPPQVLATRAHGSVVVAPGSAAGSPLLSSVLGPALQPAPLAAWTPPGFAPPPAPPPPGSPAPPSAFAAGDDVLYAGVTADGRALLARAAAPGTPWTAALRGSGVTAVADAAASGGGAAVLATADAAASNAGGAVVLATVDGAALVRQDGAGFAPTQWLSRGGAIRAVAVAVDAAGDVLAAWDRGGAIEARTWSPRDRRLGPPQRLGRAPASLGAIQLTAAVAPGGRAIVAWCGEGDAHGHELAGTISAAIRLPGRAFAAARRLAAYGAIQTPRVAAVYTRDRRGLIVWQGDAGIVARRVGTRRPGAAQVITKDGDHGEYAAELRGLVAAPGGQAVLVWDAEVATAGIVHAALLPRAGDRFGPPQTVRALGIPVGHESVAVDASNHAIVAWPAPVPVAPGSAADGIEVASRPLG